MPNAEPQAVTRILAKLLEHYGTEIMLLHCFPIRV